MTQQLQRITLLLLTCVWLGSAPAYAEAPTATAEQQSSATDTDVKADCPPRADEIWFISTRAIGWSNSKDPHSMAFDVRRREGEEWVDSTLDEFLDADDPEMPTVFYVHGNRVNWSQAFTMGWATYHATYDCSHAPPVRFVIWSWPTGQICGPLKDIRAKAARSDFETRLLATVLAEIDPQVPIGLLGYSYGARVATGALHLLAGGEFCGATVSAGARPAAAPEPAAPGDEVVAGEASAAANEAPSPSDVVLDDPGADRGRIHVVLTAAAVHNYWILPDRAHGEALTSVDRLLLLYNSCDPVLQRYRFIEKYYNPAALGYTGFVGMNELAPFGDRLEEHDVCNIVGRTHNEYAYLNSTWIMSKIRAELFGE